MTENKIINKEEGEFEIIYVSEMEFNKEYFKEYESSFLKVYFHPKGVYFEEQVNKILDSNEDMLLNEIKQIIDNHDNIYKYFDYELRFFSKGYNIGKNNFSQNIVINANLSIDFRLKEIYN